MMQLTKDENNSESSAEFALSRNDINDLANLSSIQATTSANREKESMTEIEGLIELSDEEIDQVSGGFWAGVAAAAAWDAIKGFGSWAGEKKWFEDNGVLTTSYAILALQEIQQDLKQHPAK